MEPTNYVCGAELDGQIEKRYFERSEYAQIVKTDRGRWYVHKMTTGVYFPARSYADAIGIRQMVATRCGVLENNLNLR